MTSIPVASIGQILLRELDTLRTEVEAYERDEDLWKAFPGVANSGGTLALHLCGNLRHYVGFHLGGVPYVRDRAAEFSQRDLPKAEILQRIQAARDVVESTLPHLDSQRLAADFPEKVGGFTLNTADFLAHLASHLGYHLGQMDYHRRLTSTSTSSVNAVSVAALNPARKS
ncbi:MAG TPA: DinB family protein [Candidatus Krumholzibacteria bacterium]|nr:DinB family protein [Candidatus Krumholzibacteria bacterium]